MKVSIASDHAGFKLKEIIISTLSYLQWIDLGTHSDLSMDYPDVVHPLVKSIHDEVSRFGILICGSGNGVCMTANKYKFIRAGLVWEPEIAKLIRQHNNANILCLPARFINENTAIKCVELFLSTEFEGGRHQKRIDKMSCYELNIAKK